MNIRMRLIAVVAGGLGLWMGSAPGQEVPVDCNKAARPGRIEGGSSRWIWIRAN